MNPIGWITTLVGPQEWEASAELRSFIQQKVQRQSPYYFQTSEQSGFDAVALTNMYPDRRVTPFAWIPGEDNIVCLVTGDEHYSKGSVLLIHWDTFRGSEVDEFYPDIVAWAKSAQHDMEVWREGAAKLGYSDP